MATRTYGELCPISRTLDLLGERWTLLVIRELLLGPKRYSELLDRLPAMGTNRLSQRLAALRKAGIITKSVVPRGYALTDTGEDLRPILYHIARWGIPLLTRHNEGDRVRAEYIALGLTAIAQDDGDGNTADLYDFHIGDERFHVARADGTYRATSGPPPGTPDGTVTGTLDDFLSTITGRADSVSIEATGPARRRLFHLLHPSAMHAVSTPSEALRGM